MAKSVERLQAITLRKRGKSVKSIARLLNVSSSTASKWVRHITLSERQIQRLMKSESNGRLRGGLKGARKNMDKKLARIAHFENEGLEKLGTISKREFLIAGLSLYWAEGSKKSQLAFINSDATMVVFIHRWFKEILEVPAQDFTFRIMINDLHRAREKIILKYWMHLTEAPKRQFRSTVFIHRPNTKKYDNHSKYFGLLVIRLRNSTEIKYKILGLIEGLKCSKVT